MIDIMSYINNIYFQLYKCSEGWTKGFSFDIRQARYFLQSGCFVAWCQLRWCLDIACVRCNHARSDHWGSAWKAWKTIAFLVWRAVPNSHPGLCYRNRARTKWRRFLLPMFPEQLCPRLWPWDLVRCLWQGPSARALSDTLDPEKPARQSEVLGPCRLFSDSGFSRRCTNDSGFPPVWHHWPHYWHQGEGNPWVLPASLDRLSRWISVWRVVIWADIDSCLISLGPVCLLGDVLPCSSFVIRHANLCTASCVLTSLVAACTWIS